MKIRMHSPFLYHLFKCCGGNYQIFVDDINDQIENKIAILYNTIEEDFANRSITVGKWNVTTKNFHDFVEQMEKNAKAKKNPSYCLFRFYNQIAKLNNHLLSSENHRNVVTQEDKDIINRFQSAYKYFYDNDAEAINIKRLKELLRRIKEGKMLSATQQEWFDFLLHERFPNFGDERRGLLERLKTKSWEEVAFGDLPRRSIMVNALQNDDRFKQLKKLFNTLNRLKQGDIDNIRINLEKISNLLDEIYQMEDYLIDRIEKREVKTNFIDSELFGEDSDSELHSHIIAFMRWIPMLSQNEPDAKMMESVDNVIDEIKVQVASILAGNNKLQTSLKKYPNDCYDSIFVQSDGVELRRLLIGAMCQEPYIHSQFQGFYGRTFVKKEVFDE